MATKSGNKERCACLIDNNHSELANVVVSWHPKGHEYYDPFRVCTNHLPFYDGKMYYMEQVEQTEGYKHLTTFTKFLNNTTSALDYDRAQKVLKRIIQGKETTRPLVRIQDANEVNRLTNVLRKVVKYGRDTVLHSWDVPSFTNSNESYTVRQTLAKGFTCDCASFVYETGLDKEHRCKHIRRVIEDPFNDADINYGLGAIEATRRLQELAKNGLVG